MTHDFKIDFDDVKIADGECEFNTDGIASYSFGAQPPDGMTIPQSAELNNLMNAITHFFKQWGTFGTEMTLLRFKKKAA